MYGLRQVKSLLSNPSGLFVEANRLYHTRFYTTAGNLNGENFLEQEWDNLIILDACRFDVFRDVAELPGETGWKQSVGSTTNEFVRHTFAGRELYDTVYVSANKWYELLRDDIDSDIYRFVPTERDAESGLTSRPETVTEAALDAYDEHPDKRFIIHYLQPHAPYLGDVGRTIEHKRGVVKLVKENDLSDATLREIYIENLELVLEEVRPLLDELSGRTVITADHGELLGDRLWPIPYKYYSHPAGVYVDELVKVPWHTIDNGKRDIQAAKEPYSDERGDTGEIKQQLEDLGYVV